MPKPSFFNKRISYIKEEKKVEVFLNFSLFHHAISSPIERICHPNYSLKGDLVYISINKEGIVSFGEIKEGIFLPFLIDISCDHLGQPKGEYLPNQMQEKIKEEQKKLILFERGDDELYYPKYLFE